MIHVLLLVFISIALVLSEASIFVSPLLGVYITAGLVLLLLALSIYDIYDLYAEDVLTLSAVIPSLALVILALQISNGTFEGFITYLFLLIVTIGYTIILRIKHNIFHFRNWKTLPIALIGGIIIGLVLSLITSRVHTIVHVELLVALIFILLKSVVESLFFQALLQNAVSLMTEFLLGIIFTSLVYALFHANKSYWQTGTYFLISLLTSSFYAYSKSIFATVILSICLNMSFFLITNGLIV